MDLNVLKYMIAIAGRGNMTRAAEELHISQPALSAAVGKLEKELGIRLFERGGRSIKLSAEGMYFLSWAKRLITLLEDGQNLLGESLRTHGSIRIGSCVENDRLFSIIANFSSKYPHITVELFGKNAVLDNYLASDLDFFVVPKSEDHGLPGIRIAMKRELFVLMSVSHRYASRDQLTFSDLAEERFAFSAGGDGTFDDLYLLCLRAGLDPRVSFLCEGLEYLLDLISETGVITIAYNTFRQFRQSMDGIVAVPLAYDLDTSDIMLVWRKEPINPLAKVFADHVKQYINEEERRR